MATWIQVQRHSYFECQQSKIPLKQKVKYTDITLIRYATTETSMKNYVEGKRGKVGKFSQGFG